MSSPPKAIGIGGLFPTISQANEWDPSQSYHLAAFLMAIENINNKTDGVYDELLPDTKLVSAIQGPVGTVQVGAAMAKWDSAFNNSGVFGFVSALSNDETVVADIIGVQSKIFQVNSVSRDTRLSQYVYMPYRFLTVAVNSFDGLVMQSLLCDYLGARRLVVITDSGYDSRATLNELEDEAFCTFDVLATIEIRVKADYSWALQEVKDTGARYFALIMYEPNMAAGFLEHGHLVGAFDDNSVIITTEKVANDIFVHFPSSTDVSAIMRGVFSVRYWPDYGLYNSPFGLDFVKRFAAQPSTLGTVTNGIHMCNNAMDDNGEFFLYRAQNNASLCTGLDFASYSTSSSTQPNMPLTYDAVVLLASAIHAAIENDVSLTDTNAIVDLIVANISFDGVSGPIKIDDGNGDFENFARGDREVGNEYYITNFNEAEYAAGNNPMVVIGNWSFTEGYSLCTGAFSPCYDPVFRTGSSSVTPDMPPPIYRTLSPGVIGGIVLFSALNLLTLLLLTVVTVRYRKSKQIKASQPVMLYTILFGGALATIRGTLGLITASDANCSAQQFIGHLAFAVMFGSLFVKSWRVHVLVNSKSLKRFKFTAGQAFRLLSVIVATVLAFLVMLELAGKPSLSYATVVSANQEYLTPKCSFYISEFSTILMVLEAMFLLFGFRICWNIRSVPDAFNESMSIAQAMMFTILVSGLIIPIIFLFGLDPLITEFLTCIGFEVASLVVLWTLFGPKLLSMFNFGNSPTSALARHSDRNKVSDKSKIAPSDNEPKAETDESTAAVFKGLKLRDRVQLCHNEIAKWQGLLMQQTQGHNSDGDSNSASASASESQVVASLHGISTKRTAHAVTTGNALPSPSKSNIYHAAPMEYIDGNNAVADFNVEDIA